MFHSARLKLTAWYLLIITLISFSFSATIYQVLTKELNRFDRMQRVRIERRFLENDFPRRMLPLPLNPELVEETKRRIFITLLLVNSGILVFAGGLGFFLAGRTLQPIKDMVDDQRRFVSDASHELKTPLTSLKSAFEVYLRDSNRTLTEADTVISESITEVNRLQFLSESLLVLAQYQSNGKSISFSQIIFSEIINTAIKQISSQAKLKNIKITSELSKISLTGDKSALSRLIVILLENAVKYSPFGKSVKINSRLEGSWAVVDVSDQGIGIPAADMPHIFDRFYRSDTARSKSAAGGYGLGLAIAKSIVDLHHGFISAVSHPGEGSVFTVKLPVKSPTHPL